MNKIDQMQKFQADVDDWIKNFNKTVDGLKDMPLAVEEQEGNINHNYELITELKEDIQNLREELKTLRLVQTVMLKEKLIKES